MRFYEFKRHVWMLWREARWQDEIPPEYRAWIVSRTNERVLNATLHHDNAPEELGLHLLHDYRDRLNTTERGRFSFWWQHVMTRGFDDNPLRGLHKPKLGVKR